MLNKLGVIDWLKRNIFWLFSTICILIELSKYQAYVLEKIPSIWLSKVKFKQHTQTPALSTCYLCGSTLWHCGGSTHPLTRCDLCDNKVQDCVNTKDIFAWKPFIVKYFQTQASTFCGICTFNCPPPQHTHHWPPIPMIHWCHQPPIHSYHHGMPCRHRSYVPPPLSHD